VDPKTLDLARPAQYTDMQAVERNLIVAEALATCDTVTQNIVLRRLEGFSWKEIEVLCGVSGHAARQRFSATVHSKDYPNPRREGCPPKLTLERLAKQPQQADSSVAFHVFHRSPSYKECRRLLARLKAKTKGSR